MRSLAFARPARKLEPGDSVRLGETLQATIAARGEGGEVEVRFALSGHDLDTAIAAQGEMPLPPYIAGKRKADAQDSSDYQTVYAAHEGSVAAPTAGLHFTAGTVCASDTEGCGAGIRHPACRRRHVSSRHRERHRSAQNASGVRDPDGAHRRQSQRAARKAGMGRIASVGTTSLRTLESAATPDGIVHSFTGETDIFITPGYRFRAVDVLLTNFHLPRSTLFMLVSAFSGLDAMQRAYAEAIAKSYRFYSYGDACLLFRPQ